MGSCDQMHVFTYKKDLNLEDEWKTGHWSLSPQNSYVGALTLSIPNIEDKMFEDVIKLSEAISVAFHPVWSVF